MFGIMSHRRLSNHLKLLTYQVSYFSLESKRNILVSEGIKGTGNVQFLQPNTVKLVKGGKKYANH